MNKLASTTIIHVNRYATTRSGLELFANFHYSPQCRSELADGGQRGGVISYHPGGMFTGSRDMDFVFPTVKQAILDDGHILVQPGHRLLVPTSGHEILQDIRSFFDYLESDRFLAALPAGVNPDLNKVLVSGFSGGGYVARLAAIELHERNLRSGQGKSKLGCVGLLSYFGMGGDVIKSPWIRAEGPQGDDNDTDSEIFDTISRLYARGEISDSPYPAEKRLKGWENDLEREPIWDWWNRCGTLSDTLCGTRGELRGSWGRSDSKKAEEVVPEKHHGLFPQIYFEGLGMGSGFPPTMLVHGTTDELVPFEESVTTRDQLQKAGVDVELVAVPGVDHWLRYSGKEESPVETEQAHAKVVEFIRS
ncbi:Alpha/Beta hydrolase protein [Filobasidium floriforme]|uniref:Alpha/Beta hydrolase protein n=1 Tax=Filobasidium floriforme TaxID=5210 RepID=UPI001E8DC6E6|nr:Alpha/Beta hydrolase protein [Filobasidium floriforme]KAH8080030.1 Alpha/Beta hydrolase protein [Filobasidium floriforme]